MRCGQLFCTNCNRNIGSGRKDVRQHIITDIHRTSKEKTIEGEREQKQLKAAIEAFEKEVAEETDGGKAIGLTNIAETVQIFRAECLKEWLKAGIPPNKLNKIRRWLEVQAGKSLSRADNLVVT